MLDYYQQQPNFNPCRTSNLQVATVKPDGFQNEITHCGFTFLFKILCHCISQYTPFYVLYSSSLRCLPPFLKHCSSLTAKFSITRHVICSGILAISSFMLVSVPLFNTTAFYHFCSQLQLSIKLSFLTSTNETELHFFKYTTNFISLKYIFWRQNQYVNNTAVLMSGLNWSL